MSAPAPAPSPAPTPAPVAPAAPTVADIPKLVKENVEKEIKPLRDEIAKLSNALAEALKAANKPAEKAAEKAAEKKDAHPEAGHGSDHHDAHSLNASSGDDIFEATGKDPVARRTATLLGTTAVGAGIGYGSVAGVPLVENIPLLSSTLASLQSGIASLASQVGLSTGSTATNAYLAALPSSTLGAMAMGAIAVPAGLWGLGKLKGLIVGKEYPGLTRPMYEALITPVQWPLGIVKHGYNALMHQRKHLSHNVHRMVHGIGHGAGHAWSHGVWPTVRPNRWAVGGTLLGGSIAAFTGAPVVVPALLAGYAGGKLLGWGVKSTSKKHDDSSGGHGH